MTETTERRRIHKSWWVHRTTALVVLGVLISMVALLGGDSIRMLVIPPCTVGECTARDVSSFDLVTGSVAENSANFATSDLLTVEDVLEKGLDLAEASPVHVAVRGTVNDGSVRCNWRGVARTPGQREEAIRLWLSLGDSDVLPNASEVERRLMNALDQTNPVYPETVRSNFRALAQGGLSSDYQFLTCYAHLTVHEYLLGSGDQNLTTISVAYDRQGEARSLDLYTQAHAAGEFGIQDLWAEGLYQDYLNQSAITVELLYAHFLEGSESVVFLSPMGAHNAIAVEAWQAVAQWDLQTDDDDVVHAVRYGIDQNGPEYTQTLAALKTRVTTAAAADDFADDRIANLSGLTQYYRDMGAYGDITPDDGSTATFTPAQPPAAMTCATGTAVTSPAVKTTEKGASGLRCGEEDIWAQAPHCGGYHWAALGHSSSCRQHPGPGWGQAGVGQAAAPVPPAPSHLG